MTVGGLPGYGAVASPAPDDATGAETIVTTTMAVPGSVDNFYTITAAIRGPDLDPLQVQIEAMISSLRYDPPVVPLASDPGAAAAKALETLGKDSPAWACFTPSDSHQMVIGSLPMGPELAHPQLATCTTTIEATPLQLRRMTALDAPRRAQSASRKRPDLRGVGEPGWHARPDERRTARWHWAPGDNETVLV